MSNSPPGPATSNSTPQNNSWLWFKSGSTAGVIPNRQLVLGIVVLIVERVQKTRASARCLA